MSIPEDWFGEVDLASLSSRSRSGLLVSSASQVVALSIQLLSTALLARLLEISDFGIVALAAMVTGFASLALDAGLTAATIQSPSISRLQISTLFWVNVGIGLGLAALVAAVSPLAAMWFLSPELPGVLCVSAMTLPIASFGFQHRALLARHSLYGRIAVVGIVERVAAFVASLSLAGLGFGYWSLVVGGVAGCFAGVVGIWVLCPWLPAWPRRNTGAMRLVRFGRSMVGFAFVNYWARNADNLIIGRVLGDASLGLYSKAYQILLLPMTPIARPVASVLVTHLSRVGHDPEVFRRTSLKAADGLVWLASPVFVFISLASPEIVFVILGDKWGEAASVVAWLALAGVVQMPLVPNGEVLVAAGRPDFLLRAAVINSLSSIAAFVLGLQIAGLVGLAACYSVSCLLVNVACVSWFMGMTGYFARSSLARVVLPGVLWWWWVIALGWAGRVICGVAGTSWHGLGIAVGATGAGVFLALTAFPVARNARRLFVAELRSYSARFVG